MQARRRVCDQEPNKRDAGRREFRRATPQSRQPDQAGSRTSDLLAAQLQPVRPLPPGRDNEAGPTARRKFGGATSRPVIGGESRFRRQDPHGGPLNGGPTECHRTNSTTSAIHRETSRGAQVPLVLSVGIRMRLGSPANHAPNKALRHNNVFSKAVVARIYGTSRPTNGAVIER